MELVDRSLCLLKLGEGEERFAREACLDDKGRKITFKGPNENHRNDERWKIESLPKVAELQEAAFPFGPGQPERKSVAVVIFDENGSSRARTPNGA